MTMRSVLKSSAVTLLTMCAVFPANADPAMDACIDAFVAEHVPKGRAVKIRKLGASASGWTKREERILLTAKGARSGTSIAAATCLVSGDGETIALHEHAATVAANAR